MPRNSKTILTEEDKEFICDNSDTMNMKQLSQKLGVNHATIRTYCHRENIKCKDWRRGLVVGPKMKKVDDTPDMPKIFVDQIYQEYHKGEMRLRERSY
jgi:hypothetical protein